MSCLPQRATRRAIRSPLTLPTQMSRPTGVATVGTRNFVVAEPNTTRTRMVVGSSSSTLMPVGQPARSPLWHATKSLGYQLSTTVGAGFGPVVAASLLATGGGEPTYVVVLVILTSLASAVAILVARESSGAQLGESPEPVSAAARTEVAQSVS